MHLLQVATDTTGVLLSLDTNFKVHSRITVYISNPCRVFPLSDTFPTLEDIPVDPASSLVVQRTVSAFAAHCLRILHPFQRLCDSIGKIKSRGALSDCLAAFGKSGRRPCCGKWACSLAHRSGHSISFTSRFPPSFAHFGSWLRIRKDTSRYAWFSSILLCCCASFVT